MSFDATPGDTLTFAPRTSWQLESGILAFALAAPTGLDGGLRDGQVLPPTHGLPLFHRFNRRTVCSATPVAALERWKLTHPQRLTLAEDRWHLLVNLVSPVAVGWPGGTDLVGRADLRLLPLGLPEITMVPDGLGYVLLAGVPVLEQEIIGALREAGYPNASIAALGVPLQALEA
jgi:hypothetical protein